METVEKILWEIRWGFMIILTVLSLIGFYIVSDESAKLYFAIFAILGTVGSLIAAIIPILLER